MKNLCWLLILLPLASCNQASETSINESGFAGMWVTPSPGTLFIYQFYRNGIPDPGFDTAEILATGLRVSGKINVVHYCMREGDSTDYYYSVAPNGDFSNGSGASDTSIAWETFPMETGQTISEPGTDTVEFGLLNLQSDVRSFIGTNMMPFAGAELSILHIREVYKTISATNGDTTNGFIDSTDLWLAPSLGLTLKKTDWQNSISSNLDDSALFETDLIKYIPQ